MKEIHNFFSEELEASLFFFGNIVEKQSNIYSPFKQTPKSINKNKSLFDTCMYVFVWCIYNQDRDICVNMLNMIFVTYWIGICPHKE